MMKKFFATLLIILLAVTACSAFAACGEKSGNQNKETTDMEEKTVKVYVGERSLEIVLADNPSAQAFAEKLADGDITVAMDDYGGFEKVGSLGFSLVRSDTFVTTSAGDVVLYLGSNITIYYDTNSYNFTLLGKIEGATRESILDFFGGYGQVNVRFSLN